jgi:hypothetical protein
MKQRDKQDMKKIKNILSDEINNTNNEFDILFLVDATGSMSQYIIAAKEETKNISKELKKLYPEKMFQYGYIFYRDPIDSKSDKHEVIDLTDNVNSFPEKIGLISANGGGDEPEDWVGAYKLANEKISWRNGIKVIIHLADAGAHGKLFTKYDKYPEEENKLIYELERCAEKGIKIFGYVIDYYAQNSFNECSKIYRRKGGSFEILQFQNIPMESMPMQMRPPNPMDPSMKPAQMMPPIQMHPSQMMSQMQMMQAPPAMYNQSQMVVNMNFQRNAIQSIQSIMDKH